MFHYLMPCLIPTLFFQSLTPPFPYVKDTQGYLLQTGQIVTLIGALYFFIRGVWICLIWFKTNSCLKGWFTLKLIFDMFLAYLKGIKDVGVFVSTAFSILRFFGQTIVVCQSYRDAVICDVTKWAWARTGWQKEPKHMQQSMSAKWQFFVRNS